MKYEEKLAHLFDKVSQIIRYIQWEINKKAKVSPLMAEIIEYLEESPYYMRTPAKIADELAVKRPTVTDSLKILIKKGYIKEIPYEKDKRYKILFLTEKGKKFLKNKNLNYKEILKNSIQSLNEEEKKSLFKSLVKFIASLNERGILPIARICLNCENFEKDKYKGKKPHYCKILRKRMSDFDLNVNCKNNVKRRELCVRV